MLKRFGGSTAIDRRATARDKLEQLMGEVALRYLDTAA